MQADAGGRDLRRGFRRPSPARRCVAVAKEVRAVLETIPRGCDTAVVFRRTLEEWILALCPPRSRGIAASAKTRARRATVRELDAIAREIVFARDENRCRRCLRTDRQLQWSHVFPKGAHKWLRWDLDNSKILCAHCHLNWWHPHPEAAMAWWEAEIGMVRMRALRMRAARPSRVDPAAVVLYLETERRRVGIGGA